MTPACPACNKNGGWPILGEIVVNEVGSKPPAPIRVDESTRDLDFAGPSASVRSAAMNRSKSPASKSHASFASTFNVAVPEITGLEAFGSSMQLTYRIENG